MPDRIRGRLTYANVVATLALFAALGGGAYAASHLPKNSVKSKNIVNGQVKQADISHTLTVSGADSATNATHATSADSATNATHAASADTATAATNASKLGGQNASAYALAGSEAVQPLVLNDGSENSFCYWTNYGQGHNDAGYYRDRAGVVHLQGLVVAHNGTSATCGSFADPGEVPYDYAVATLPAGYRPASDSGMPTVSNDAPGLINVGSNGDVAIEQNFPTLANAKQWVLLDGISFRCAPSGQDGCP